MRPCHITLRRTLLQLQKVRSVIQPSVIRLYTPRASVRTFSSIHQIQSRSPQSFCSSQRAMATLTTTSSRVQPPWKQPIPAADAPALPPLKMYNSLTRSKVPFVPLDRGGKKVTWYCCGPTVYDAGHLGHARNYVTTDILRRIMRDYFGFDVTFVQNVTDVDDKIILRARENHLFTEFCERNPSITPEVKSTALAAWKHYVAEKLKLAEGDSVTPETFPSWATAHKDHARIYAIVAKEANRKPGEEAEESLLNEKDTKTKMHIKTLLTSSSVLVETPKTPQEFYAAIASILPTYLDFNARKENREYGMEIFSKLSTYWENHFNEDMQRLNVIPPTIITRVSEFIPENVAFIQRLVEKGLAYQTQNGSVYFDIQAYETTGHHYAKLEPWNKGDATLLADGEGSLSTHPGESSTPNTAPTSNVFVKEKKSSNDFALWKSSKSGEPSWPSPWGPGRPGWHIECSVMAGHVLGGKIDIHSGGIDLAFPHHDNEIAQSEAYWDGDYKNNDQCCATTGGDEKHQWINYFLHMGHLSIQGSKMSKSLKNFVSIREALARGPQGETPAWTARGLRVVFLMGGWKEGIEVGMGVLKQARAWEESIGKFFINVKALTAEESEKEKRGDFIPMKFTPAEHQIYQDLDDARSSLHAALCDNFNTPAAMQILSEIVQKANVYMLNNKDSFSLPAVKEIARWVTRIVNIFGLDSNPYVGDKIGWGDANASESDGAANKEEILMPYLRVLSSFRDRIRAMAIANKEGVSSKELLTVCDVLRNDELPPLGVSLDDRDTAVALVKLVSPEELQAQKAEKERKATEKEANRLALKAEREAAEKKRLEAGKLNPSEMFKPPHSDEFEEWDAEGLPTKIKGGEEVAKSRGKKLKKDWERQKKLHEAWKAAQGEN